MSCTFARSAGPFGGQNGQSIYVYKFTLRFVSEGRAHSARPNNIIITCSHMHNINLHYYNYNFIANLHESTNASFL